MLTIARHQTLPNRDESIAQSHTAFFIIPINTILPFFKARSAKYSSRLFPSFIHNKMFVGFLNSRQHLCQVPLQLIMWADD